MRLEEMTFRQIYLIYLNDFVTLDRMAEYYRVHPDLLKLWIDIGKEDKNEEKTQTGKDWEEFQQQVNDLYFNLI